MKISVWLRENHLFLNVEEKTLFMIFRKPKPVLAPDYPPVLIGNNALGRVLKARYLRVKLDQHFRIRPRNISVTKKVDKFVPIF